MAYTPTTWTDGDLITAEKLNKLEAEYKTNKLGRRGLLDQKEIPEHRARKAIKEILEHRAQKALTGKTAHRAPPERMESPLRPLR